MLQILPSNYTIPIKLRVLRTIMVHLSLMLCPANRIGFLQQDCPAINVTILPNLTFKKSESASACQQEGLKGTRVDDEQQVAVPLHFSITFGAPLERNSPLHSFDTDLASWVKVCESSVHERDGKERLLFCMITSMCFESVITNKNSYGFNIYFL